MNGKNRIKIFVRALRVHQWVKNLLVFLPLIMAHRAGNGLMLVQTLAAFFSFSLCASAVYLINDIMDLEADRNHESKRLRPIASGQFAVRSAALTALIGLILSGAAAALLPDKFGLCLAFYFLVTTLYSMHFKKIVVADIVILALLYALRILAGGFAAGIPVSQWLLAFSMFFFLSLACVKRFSELRTLRAANHEGGAGNRRGYRPEDLEQIAQFGSSSGYISVLVLALYISSRDVSVLYRHPQAIWLVCPLILYWISRVWLLARRGEVHEDPILFAISDRVSYLVGLLSAALIFIAV